MPPKLDPTTWSTLSQLVAAHGVYALTVIVIFYMWRQAVADLKNGKPQDHAHYRKVQDAVIAIAFGLIIASTVVWIYATFFYGRKVYLKGAVVGLIDQPVVPQKSDDPPMVVQQIAPVSLDIELYQSKKIETESLAKGAHTLLWVLLPNKNLKTVAFHFQNQYKIFRAARRTLNLFASNTPPFEEGNPEGVFLVKLEDIQYSPGSLIQLKHVPAADDPVRKLGQMILENPDGSTVPLPWQPEQSTKPAVPANAYIHMLEPGWLSPLSVYAWSMGEKSPFGPNGDYDSQFGRALRQRLGSPSLEAQSEAVRILVENGNRSFKFIGDTLVNPPHAGLDLSLLTSNLGKVVEGIESGGNPTPPDLNLKLAAAFFQIQDYKSAAHFFDKAGVSPQDKNEYYFMRGLAYAENGENRKAVENYKVFLTRDKRAKDQASTRGNLGNAYFALGDSAAAIAEYQKAMQLDPTLASTYNNLAYLYAEQEKNLPQALSLVNRAIELDPKEPDFKDTKGWVLCKMGNAKDGASLIEEAAKAEPYNMDIRKHLEIAQGLANRPEKK